MFDSFSTTISFWEDTVWIGWLITFSHSLYLWVDWWSPVPSPLSFTNTHPSGLSICVVFTTIIFCETIKVISLDLDLEGSYVRVAGLGGGGAFPPYIAVENREDWVLEEFKVMRNTRTNLVNQWVLIMEFNLYQVLKYPFALSITFKMVVLIFIE